MLEPNVEGAERLFAATCQMTREAIQRSAAEIAPRQSIHLNEAVRLLDFLEVWGRALKDDAIKTKAEGRANG